MKRCERARDDIRAKMIAGHARWRERHYRFKGVPPELIEDYRALRPKIGAFAALEAIRDIAAQRGIVCPSAQNFRSNPRAVSHPARREIGGEGVSCRAGLQPLTLSPDLAQISRPFSCDDAAGRQAERVS